MTRKTFQLAIAIIFIILIILRLFFATFFPVTLDEAYYFQWARHLDFGYLDHPPMIAFLTSAGQFLETGVLGYRVLGLILSFLLPIVCLSIYRQIGIKSYQTQFTALVLTCFSFGGLILGFLQTPDLPLIVFWTLAIHEGNAALLGKPWRWLTAGIVTGLGIMSKYTMFLMGPIYLIALLRSPKGLNQKWPYLGGLLCLLVVSPHLYWNSQNDWVSFRFQLGRGFFSQYEIEAKLGTQLPPAKEAKLDSPEYKLARPFFPKKRKVEKEKTPFEKSIQKIGDYLGGLVLLWGIMLIPLLGSARKVLKLNNQASKRDLHAAALPMIWGGSLVPVVLFGLLSPFQKIEANWAAMYMVTAAPLLASYLNNMRLRNLFIASGINISIVLGLTIYAVKPALFPFSIKRINEETFGFNQLAAYLSKLKAPIFVDSYQNLSMLSFYAPPTISFVQWPGVTRVSEFIRRSEFNHYTLEDLSRDSAFYFISNQIQPPHLKGFSAQSLERVDICADRGLRIIRNAKEENQIPTCSGAHRQWTLTYYKKTKT